MKIRGSEIATGLFALTVVAVGIVLLMLGGFFSGGGETRDCVAYFDDINLLEPNARVAMNGFEVGRVTGLEPVIPKDPDGQVMIRVVFEMKEEVLDDLGADTVAEIGQESFLGAKYVKILPATTGGAFSTEDELVRIETKPLFDMFAAFRDVKASLDPIVLKLQQTLDTLNDDILAKVGEDLLSRQNLDNIESMLSGGSRLVGESQQMVEKINARLNREGGTFDAADRLVAELREAVQAARTALDDLTRRGGGTLDNVDATLKNMSVTIDTLRNRLDQDIVPAMEDVLARASRFLDDSSRSVDTLSADASRTLDGVDRLVRDPNIYGALLEVRELLREMKLLTLSLRSDPSQLIFGGPGEVEEAAEPRIDRSREALDGRGAPYGY